MLYARLAFSNIKKSFKDYAVYFITLILGVSVFYAFNTLSMQTEFLSIESQEFAAGIGSGVAGLTIFLSIILGSLMVYANNYLVKRRKKELGLYQVLGIRKIQVSSILLIETLCVSLLSFVFGILLGILLSQLMVFLTASFFRETVIDFNFIFSWDAFAITLKSFAVIFLVMLLFNLKTLKRVELVDLMGAHRKNQKFKTRNGFVTLVMFAVSLILIGWAYHRLYVHSYSPIFGLGARDFSSVLKNEFTHTTLLMVVGTILFFYSVANAFLKMAQLNKRHYFSGLTMFTTRQLSSKAHTFTGSLVCITILLFFPLSSIIFGMSLADSCEKLMDSNVPYSATATFYNSQLDYDHDTKHAAKMPDFVTAFKEAGLDLTNKSYKYAEVPVFDSNCLPNVSRVSLKTLVDTSGIAAPSIFDTAVSSEGNMGTEALGMYFMRESDYLKTCKLLKVDPVKLGKDQYVILSNLGTDLPKYYGEVMAAGTKLDILGHKVTPASNECITGKNAVLAQGPIGLNPGAIVVKDEVIPEQAIPFQINFLINNLDDKEVAYEDITFNESIFPYELMTISSQKALYNQAVGLMAIISYLSIFIGIVMIMACGAIISIQQLSFAVDSKENYRMLDRLGCSERLANKSLFKQILIYFSLPLLIAGIHSYVALDVLFKEISSLWPISLSGMAINIAIIFFILYVIYFACTYYTAKSIVRVRD